MKTKLAALTLIAFICWLIPIKVLAQETDRPKQKEAEILVVAVHETGNYKSEDIIIKDNAIQPISPIHSKAVQPAPKVEPRKEYSGRNYSKEEVIQLIRDYSAEYGIPADLPLRIANCESGYNQFAKNKHSSASGIAQYLNTTWAATDEGKAGLSVLMPRPTFERWLST